MTLPLRMVFAWLLPLVVIAPAVPARQPAPQAATSGVTERQPDALQGYAERLAALEPSHPLEYMKLAEEIAAEVRTAEGRDLARRLYVLSILAPRHAGKPLKVDESAAPPWLASSASLGLAALAPNEQDRRWLTALAGTLAPSDASGPHGIAPEAAVRDSAALELATALGMVRSGEGRRAQKILEKPAVAALLNRYEGLLSPGGLSGGASRIRSLAEKYPVCPECRNRRYIKNADGIHLCPTCQGRPGPKLSPQELIGQLRLESLLLNGIQRSWAAQVVADGGAPMRELDVEVLADVYGVDAASAYWRAGAWARDPNAPKEPSAAAAPQTSPSGPIGPEPPPLPPAEAAPSRR